MASVRSNDGGRIAGSARRSEWVLVGAAAAALAAGALIYALARPVPAALLPRALHAPQPQAVALRPLTGALPTFLHVFAFSLATIAVVGGGRHAAVCSCVAWTAVNALFEIGQHPDVVQAIARSLGGHPAYRAGTFDPNDLVAAGLGGVLAFVVACRPSPETYDANR